MNTTTITKESVNVKDFSNDEIKEGLVLLMRKRIHDERVKSGEIKSQKWSEKTLEQKQKHIQYNKERMKKIQLLARKAKEMGIKVD